MKNIFLRVLVFIICMAPAYADTLSKSEQCKYITETMLEIAAQGAGDEALRKLNSEELYNKAHSSCMTGTEGDVSELYNKLQ